MREPNATVEVRIEAPSAPAHVYAADPGGRAVRLRGTLRDVERQVADWAIVPGTLTPAGEPLGVLVVTDVPCSPDALAAVRLLGTVTAGEERVMVAVLADDPAVAGMVTWEQLADDTREGIEALLARDGHGSGVVTRWHGPAETARAVFDARQAARLARAAYHAARARRPAWQAGGADGSPGFRGDGDPESELRRLPFRFQEYVAALVQAEERILSFAPRPRDHRSVRRWLGRRVRAEEGVLIATDQQVLWIRDVLAAPVDVIGYGYVARSVPAERLAGARLHTSDSGCSIEIESRNGRSVVWTLDVAFPAASLGLVREVVATVQQFTGAGERVALMRLARPPADDSPLSRLVKGEDQATRSATDEWERRLSELLASDERAVARAVVPAWAAHDGVPGLWVVTSGRLLHLAARPDIAARSWRMADLGAVTLTHSVFESSLQFEWAGAIERGRERVVFPLVAAGAFTRLFVAMRRAMVGHEGFVVEGEAEAAVAPDGDPAAPGRSRAAEAVGQGQHVDRLA